MRVALRRSGGFANIGAHADLETASLPQEKAEELQRLIRSASLPDQPPPPIRAARAADAYQYDITIDGKTYTADELSMPDSWRPLVDYLMENTK